MLQAYLYLFVSGLLFGSGPCVASCGPLLISYIAGTGKGIKKALGAYFIFSLSRVAAYCILAAAIFYAGAHIFERSFARYEPYLLAGGGVFIVLIGVATALGVNVGIPFLKICRCAVLEHDAKNLIAFGFIVGLLPCGPLLAIFSYIGLVSKTWETSCAYGLVFGMGTIVSPLLALAIFAGLLRNLKPAPEMMLRRLLNAVCGCVLVIYGMLLIRRGL